jgi:hypothetical protein
MVYHRTSLNYYLNIMLIRRGLTLALAVPGAARLMASLSGEDRAVLEGHRELLQQHGIGYLTDSRLNNNTDGPGNSLSLEGLHPWTSRGAAAPTGSAPRRDPVPQSAPGSRAI